MRRAATNRPLRTAIRFALPAMAIAALLSPAAAAGAGQATKRVAKQAENTALGRTVLTTTKGRTLYSLSVEKHGKFICTGTCLSAWHPLVVTAGTKPVGPVRFGTVERPDGRTQVTFKGRPLYTFSGDSKAGDVNGEGIKDVGTWHAASLAKTASQPQPAPEQPAYPSQPQPESTYPTPTPTQPQPDPKPKPEPPYPY